MEFQVRGYQIDIFRLKNDKTQSKSFMFFFKCANEKYLKNHEILNVFIESWPNFCRLDINPFQKNI